METGLNSQEQELVLNTEWLFLKAEIIKKVVHVFAQTAEDFVTISKILPPEVTATSPKISKGENYEGLPYVMLDYPRIFQKENKLAVRTFFWWGHFFSITLHLSGAHLNNFSGCLLKNFPSLFKNGWQIQTGVDEWNHQFENNYQPIGPSSHSDLVNLPFLKLAKKIPLQEWDNLSNILKVEFAFILSMLYN